jgi:flagellar hook-length control protein FliK
MDSAGAPQVIENSSRRLAVGVRNADLGWVEIRTSNAAGQVSATVATSSVESHNVVLAQLPSVREYLAGQQVRVDHLASESFSPSSGHREASPGDQFRDGGGARNTKAPEQAIKARTSVADPDAESLSYINVRV